MMDWITGVALFVAGWGAGLLWTTWFEDREDRRAGRSGRTRG